MNATSKKPKPSAASYQSAGEVRSLRGLARAVDRAPSAVHRWLKHPEWTFSTTPPWSAATVTAIKNWAADTLKQDPDRDEYEVGNAHADNELAIVMRNIEEMTGKSYDQWISEYVADLHRRADEADAELAAERAAEQRK